MTDTNFFWRKLFKTSALYLFGTVVARMVTFLLLPLYTSRIPTDEYGTYDLVLAYAAIIIPLIGVNCWQGMLRFTIEEKSLEKRHHIISHGWLMLIISIIALSVLFFVVSSFLSFSCKFLVYEYFVAQLLQYFYIYSSRGFGKNMVYALSGVISAFTIAIVSIICIFVFDLTLESLYISQICSLLIQVSFIEFNIHLFKDIRLHAFSIDLLKNLYKFCIPDSVGTIFNWLLNSANRLVIVAVLGYSANGIYAISNKFVSILSVFMTAFILSFQESLYSAPPDKLKLFADDVIDKYLHVAALVIALLLLSTSIIYPLFVAGSYSEGYYLIPIFYAYFFVTGITWIMSSVVSATKQTKITLYEKIIIGPINFMLVLSLISYIGLYSSPLSLFISEGIGIIAFVVMLNKFAGVRLGINYLHLILDILILGIASIIFVMNNLYLNILVISLSLIIASLFYKKGAKFLIANVTNRFKHVIN